MTRRPDTESGFTLIELAVIVAIICTLSAIGMVYFNDAIRVSRDTAAISDAKNFIAVMSDVIVGRQIQTSVDLTVVHADGQVGDPPVFRLSPNVQLYYPAADPTINQFFNDARPTRIFVYFYSPMGTEDPYDFSGTGLMRRCVYVIMDEQTKQQELILF